MRASGGMRVMLVLAWTVGSGCTALREIPREEYVSRVSRRPVRVETREGLHYELDSARIEADTLVGFRRRDVEGPIEEFDTLRLPLSEVATISARSIDWYRTGLIGGLSLAAVVAAGLSRHGSNVGPAPTPPCDREPCQ